MAEINIFNTFSFKKWSARLREQKMEEEIQRQRMDQVARLRDKLGRERALREQADMLNDDDIGELIKFLNAGGSLGFGMPQAAGNNKNGPPAPVTIAATVVQNPVNDLALFGQMPKSDKYILDEIKNYSKRKGDISTIPQTIFNYNRRWNEMIKERSRNPKEIDASRLYEFEYNRRYGNLV